MIERIMSKITCISALEVEEKRIEGTRFGLWFSRSRGCENNRFIEWINDSIIPQLSPINVSL